MRPPPQVNGQTTHYRVVAVAKLNGVPPVGLNTFGLNNKNQAVFPVRIGTTWHAHAWLPAADYGLSSAGLIDLHAAGGTGGGESTANDINENGYVAGVTGGVGVTPGQSPQGQAAVWQLASTITLTPLGFLSGGEWSAAHAVSNHADPVIVGQSEFEGVCVGDTLGGFRTRLSDPDPELLGPLTAIHDDGFAHDVNDLTFFAWPTVSGGDDINQAFCDVPHCQTCCSFPRDAFRWLATTTTPLPELSEDDEERDHVALGLNNAGQAVGYGFQQPLETEFCIQEAMFWEAGASPAFFVLGQLVPGLLGPPYDNTRAEAINEPDPVTGRIQVVGTNVTDNDGLIWTRTGSGASASWTVQNLEDVLCSACVSQWDIFEAYDINDQGYILALADADLSGGFDLHAVLLVPVTGCISATCPADFNGDAVVDGLDLALLLGAWGDPCGLGPCPYDLTCDDSIVDGLDLALLLGAWGPCSSGLTGGSVPFGAESATTGSALPTLSELIAALIQIGEADLIPILVEHWSGD